ncbi:MAG: LysR substrate-binding domain-containing protein [Betaproteobacteria bacterium]
MAKRRRPRLSLELLKGFQASARCLNFTRAAQDLFVTQSAISRGVKALEQQLGRQLFHRVARGLTLTDAGQALYRAVDEAFNLIDSATDQIAGAAGRQNLTITTNVASASLWLVPRLTRFSRLCPDINVRIVATNKVVNLDREHIDIAIRHFPPEAELSVGKLLVMEKVFPVCAPRLARGRTRPLRSPEDLARHVLLQFETYTLNGPWLDWARWLDAMKLGNLTPAGPLRFSHYDQVIQAAVDGGGIALGRYPLVASLLREGRLVALFDEREVISGGLFVVAAARSAERDAVNAFVAWLRDEVQRDEGLVGGRRVKRYEPVSRSIE